MGQPPPLPALPAGGPAPAPPGPDLARSYAARLPALLDLGIHPADVAAATPEVEKAWRTIADQGLAEEGVAVDVDTAQLELGRLCQEIEDLSRQVELLR